MNIGLKAMLTLVAICAAQAQMQDNQEKQMRCDNRLGGDRAHFCEIREQTIPTTGHLNIDGAENGGVSVKGWLRNDVLVRSKVEAWADSESAAQVLSRQVRVDTSGGQIRAAGPDTGDHSGWGVSYEIFVPQTTDLALKTNNGGITISDVRGRIQFEAANGGVHLRRIAGDVSGTTVNGGLNVELAGNAWEGRQLDVRTTNGGVTLSIPETYSARLETETVNGGIRSDFPVTIQGDNSHRLAFNLGSGGPLVRVATTNGGVRLKRL